MPPDQDAYSFVGYVRSSNLPIQQLEASSVILTTPLPLPTHAGEFNDEEKKLGFPKSYSEREGYIHGGHMAPLTNRAKANRHLTKRISAFPYARAFEIPLLRFSIVICNTSLRSYEWLRPYSYTWSVIYIRLPQVSPASKQRWSSGARLPRQAAH